jgi:large subunit ribosomal protein L19
VSRAKLYYLRGKVGKKARVREKRYGAGAAAANAAAAAEKSKPATEEAPAATEPEDAPEPVAEPAETA